jgi:putative aminopeptidase FrvX
LETSAQSISVELQHEILDRSDSETAGCHLLAAGLRAGALGIPARYRLTPNEMVNISDIERTADILAEFLKQSNSIRPSLNYHDDQRKE